MQAFLQSLMAALHAQAANAASATGTSDQNSSSTGSSSVAAVSSASSGVSRPHHGGGHMQSLVDQLAASDASDSSSTSSTAAASATSDPTLSNLQTSFNNLVTAMGGSTDSSQTTMSNFLSTLASDMQGASPIGNLLSAQA
jgi:hypothetical protein